MKNQHFRELKSWPLAPGDVPAPFRQFVERVLWPELEALHQGYKQAEKKEAAVAVAHALVASGLAGGVVADKRGKSSPGVRLRVKIWDAFIEAGFARACKGSQESGKVTRYRATGLLLDLHEWTGQDLIAPDSGCHSPIICHTGRRDLSTGEMLPEKDARQPLSITDAIWRMVGATDTPDARRVETAQRWEAIYQHIGKQIDSLNAFNLGAGWQTVSDPEADPEGEGVARPRPVDPRVRSVGAGVLPVGTGRLYTFGPNGGQGLSRWARERLTIGHQAAAELDSVSHQIRLLYHVQGLRADGDTYRPEKVFPAFYGHANASAGGRKTIRNFVKKCTCILLNSGSRLRSLTGIGHHLRTHPDKDFLTKTIFTTEGTDLGGIVERISSAHHRDIRPLFSTLIHPQTKGLPTSVAEVRRPVGAALMDLDGNIMFQALRQLLRKKIPALGIHDSLVVRKDDIARAEEVYAWAYSHELKFHTGRGFDPVLQRVF